MCFRAAVSPTWVHPISTVTAMGRPKIYDEPRVATAFEQPASVHDYLQRTTVVSSDNSGATNRR